MLTSSKAGTNILLCYTSITVASAESILSQYLHLYNFIREVYTISDH